MDKRRLIQQFISWLRHYDLIVLLAALVLVAGTWGFIELADEVSEGATRHFDQWVMQSLRQKDNPEVPLGPKWLTQSARDVTGLGSYSVLFLVTASSFGYLLLKRNHPTAFLLASAVLSGLALNLLLKTVFARPRPGVPHLTFVNSWSFPSGHAMISAIVYLTLGALLARIEPKRSAKIYLVGIALFITFLIGLTRVYLGVHYPTDVLAGWTAGLVWAVFFWLISRYLKERGVRA